MNAASRKACFPHTRVHILNFISEWIVNPSGAKNVLWIYGLAGAGKSTLANTIANRFRDVGRLASFIFFDRNVADRSNPENVITTLAYHLAEFDGRIAAAISAAIERQPGIVRAPLDTQITKLLVEPIRAVKDLTSEGSIVVIFDALDECGTAMSRMTLLRLLVDRLPLLPSAIRILIMSRADFDISRAFESCATIQRRELDISSGANSEDILLCLRTGMKGIRRDNDDLMLPISWPGDNEVRALAKRSAGLFIWASTAIAFIADGHDPRERLAILLNREVREQAESALDDLYITALLTVGKWNDNTFASDFRAILGIILVSRYPLTLNTIDNLSGLHGERPASHTIRRLRCVLHWSQDGRVHILHPSFADFLRNRMRCKDDNWYIDKEEHGRLMSSHCLDILSEYLSARQYSPSSPPSTQDIDHFPEHVHYAMTNWMAHVGHGVVYFRQPYFRDSLVRFLRTSAKTWVAIPLRLGHESRFLKFLSMIAVCSRIETDVIKAY
jgi:hypothetical protein